MATPVTVSQTVLTAYETVHVEGSHLLPGTPGRDWMDDTYERLAYRCLPMLIANQTGWMITCPATISVKWDGGPGVDAIRFRRLQSWRPDPHLWPSSQFGTGIITFIPPFVFRTPPGYNLLVRGPANHPKDGAAPLEGVVETDWTSAMFTMNWKITRTNTWITFEKGEPICMIVPQRRGELEEFTTQIRPISDNPELQESHQCWRRDRAEFNQTRRIPDSQAAKQGWQKHYVQGTSPDGLVVAPAEHQTRLHLSQFTRS